MLGAISHIVLQFLIQPALPRWASSARLSNRVFGQVISTLTSLLTTVPLEIATTRLMASSLSFPVSTPIQNLRKLFSSQERSRPFLHLFTPSRVLAGLIPVAATMLFRSFVPIGEPPTGYTTDRSRIVALAVEIAISLVTIPFSVMADRLYVQREEGQGEKVPKEADMSETSVTLRSKPYHNLKDCYNSIVAEEGYGTLFRGWPFEVACILGTRYLGYYVEVGARTAKTVATSAE